MDKVQLRKNLLKRREKFKERSTEFAQSCSMLSRHIHHFLKEFPKDSLLFGYRAYKSEAPIPWIQGFRWAFPRSQGVGVMSFFEASNLKEDFEISQRGIQEPVFKETAKVEGNQAKVIFVPGVGFDRAGHRMGYGFGYYDRFLAPLKGVLKVGVGFEMQVQETKLPIDAWDLPLDWMITDKKITGFSLKE